MKKMSSIRTVFVLLGALSVTLVLASLLHADAQAGDAYQNVLAPQDDHEPVLVKDVNAVSLGSDPRDIIVLDDTTYFVAGNRELWRSDGSPQDTTLVKDLLPTIRR
jgi:ELWxxDGT repeat protein